MKNNLQSSQNACTKYGNFLSFLAHRTKVIVERMVGVVVGLSLSVTNVLWLNGKS